DAERNVSAIALVIHDSFVDADIAGCVIDVCVGAGGWRNDGYFTGLRIRAAKPVDLSRIRTAEDGDDDSIARDRTVRQVARVNVNTFTGAAADDCRADSIRTHHLLRGSRLLQHGLRHVRTRRDRRCRVDFACRRIDREPVWTPLNMDDV